jgi:hypothetical protein
MWQRALSGSGGGSTSYFIGMNRSLGVFVYADGEIKKIERLNSDVSYSDEYVSVSVNSNNYNTTITPQKNCTEHSYVASSFNEVVTQRTAGQSYTMDISTTVSVLNF